MSKELKRSKNKYNQIVYRIDLNDMIYGEICQDFADPEFEWTWIINVDGTVIFCDHCESLKEAESYLMKEINVIRNQYLKDNDDE